MVSLLEPLSFATPIQRRALRLTHPLFMPRSA
jgi:hypothetical protein